MNFTPENNPLRLLNKPHTNSDFMSWSDNFIVFNAFKAVKRLTVSKFNGIMAVSTAYQY